jgi:hypothetical protein
MTHQISSPIHTYVIHFINGGDIIDPAPNLSSWQHVSHPATDSGVRNPIRIYSRLAAVGPQALNPPASPALKTPPCPPPTAIPCSVRVRDNLIAAKPVRRVDSLVPRRRRHGRRQAGGRQPRRVDWPAVHGRGEGRRRRQ